MMDDFLAILGAIAASMATMAFNKAFNEGVRHRNLDYYAAHATMDKPLPTG